MGKQVTKVVEFQHPLDREPPLTVAVRAVFRHVAGEPGSLGVAAGWEMDELQVTQPSAEPRVTEVEMVDLEREAISRL